MLPFEPLCVGRILHSEFSIELCYKDPAFMQTANYHITVESYILHTNAISPLKHRHLFIMPASGIKLLTLKLN